MSRRLSEQMHFLLTEEVIRSLHSNNVFTVSDFIYRKTSRQLSKIVSLSYREILMLRKELKHKNLITVKTAYHKYSKILNNCSIVATGLSSVDLILDGGFIGGNIYELCGFPGSGKTQFVLTLLKNASLNGQYSYLLATGHNFCSNKLNTIIGDEKKNVLDKILVKQITTRYEILNSLYDIKNQLEFNKIHIKLLIIDTLPDILLTIDCFLEKNCFLNNLVNILRYIAVKHFVVILITNLLTSWKTNVVNRETICCGKYWYSIPHTRLIIAKNTNNYSISIFNSNTLTENKCATINITDRGIKSL